MNTDFQSGRALISQAIWFYISLYRAARRRWEVYL